MATEAISKIKEAENTAAAILEKAIESSKSIIKNAEIQGESQYDSLVNKAEEEAKTIKENATLEGRVKTEPIIRLGDEQISKIINIDQDKFNSAVNLVIERIVNFNGNS